MPNRNNIFNSYDPSNAYAEGVSRSLGGQSKENEELEKKMRLLALQKMAQSNMQQPAAEQVPPPSGSNYLNEKSPEDLQKASMERLKMLDEASRNELLQENPQLQQLYKKYYK